MVEAPWQFWMSQFAAILRIEIKKNLWMRRSIWIYLLALAPTGMFGIHALTSPMGRNCSLEEDTRIFAYIFQIFYLRVGIFFGCMGLFTWLFRGEDRGKEPALLFPLTHASRAAGSREVCGRPHHRRRWSLALPYCSASPLFMAILARPDARLCSTARALAI